MGVKIRATSAQFQTTSNKLLTQLGQIAVADWSLAKKKFNLSKTRSCLSNYFSHFCLSVQTVINKESTSTIQFNLLLHSQHIWLTKFGESFGQMKFSLWIFQFQVHSKEKIIISDNNNCKTTNNLLIPFSHKTRIV